MADTAPAPDRLARADLCRFVAACYYEPGPEFAEERVFDSMVAAARRVDPDLAESAQRVGEAFHDLDELLVDYTRILLGPSMVFTKPYGSVWAGASDLPALYAEAGFETSADFRDLPDHIAAELEFLYLLIHQDAPADLRRRFVVGHLSKWVPAFASAVQAGAETEFYRRLAELTARLVALEAKRAA